MKNKSLFFVRFLTAFILLGSLSCLRAQEAMPLYYMNILPQRSAWNPAYQAPCQAYFGFPGASGIHAQVNNDAFAWGNIIERGADDSLRFNIGKFVGRLQSKNLIGADVTEEILRIGFRSGENYFNVGLSAQVNANVALSKDLLSFLLLGPGQFLGNNTFTGNSIDINAYAYLYLGWSRKISRMVTVGAKFKIINGLYNFHTKQMDLTWNVVNAEMEDPNLTPYTYQLRASGELRTNIPIDENNKIGSLGFPIGQNWGFGIDLGLSVDFAPNWNFSASILDMGAIFWRDINASTLKSKSSELYNYQGLNRINFMGENSNISFDSVLRRSVTQLLDTLRFEKTDQKGYTSSLPTTFTVGFSYTLIEQHQFGALFKGRIYNQYFSADLGVAYTYTPCKNFSVSVSNTFGRSGPLNLGIGLAGNLGPVQLHLAVDRINAFNVKNVRTLAISFGINFMIGKHEILPSRIASEKSRRASEENTKY